MEKKPISIRDVARRAGVSISSVSRVMNEGSGPVSPRTRAKVLKAVHELDYSPSWIGQALRGAAKDTFAMIVSNIQNNFFSAVAWEIESRLNRDGSAMLLFNTNEMAEIQDRCIDEIRSRQVAGVFMLCAVESAKLGELMARIPTLLINRRIATYPDAPFVGIDDRAAAGELARLVLRDHAGRVGLIHGPATSDTSARRLDGFLAAFANAGRPIPPADRRESALSMEGGYARAVELLADGPFDAVICGNDPIAYGLYRRCRELGLSVPGQIAVYGFDDNPLNIWLAPWLSTVSVPHLQYADAAIDRMTDLRAGRQVGETVIPYDIVLRH